MYDKYKTKGEFEVGGGEGRGMALVGGYKYISNTTIILYIITIF